MAFSSLADELAAFDDHMEQAHGHDGMGMGMSLAEEFGLDMQPEGEALEYELQGGEFGGEVDEDQQSSPPVSPTHGGQHKSPHSADTDPFLSPTGLEYELHPHSEIEPGPSNGGGSYQPLLSDDDYTEADIPELDHSPIPSPLQIRSKARNVRTQPSTKSLRGRRSHLQFYPQPSEKGTDDAIIVLSETLGTTSRFLTSLKNLDGPGGQSVGAVSSCAIPGSPIVRTKVDAVGAEGTGSIEIKLQSHLNTMLDAERRREEMLRELGIISREAGLGGLGSGPTTAGTATDAVDVQQGSVQLDRLEEEDEEEPYEGGWTGESGVVIPHTEQGMPSSSLSSNGQYGSQESGATGTDRAEEDQVDPLDALMEAEEGHPIHVSSSSRVRSRARPISPLTPSSSTGQAHFHSHSTPTLTPLLPRLTTLVVSDTHALLDILRHLQETLHTSSSLSTALSRQMKGMRSSLESWREDERAFLSAQARIEEWEEERVRDGLKGDSLADRLRREYEEFGQRLEGYGRRLEECKRAATVR